MDKRGQVTLFVIIAVVVISIILFVYFVVRPLFYEKEKFDEISTKSYAQDKINDLTLGSLVLVGLQGGYDELPSRNLETMVEVIPYYCYEGQIFVPSLSTVEKQLSEKVEEELDNLDFENLTQTGIKISKGEPKVETKILDGVQFYISWPIILSKDESSIELTSKYFVSYDIKLGKILEVARIIAIKASEENVINLEFINELQKDYNLTIYPQLYGNSTIYTIYDIYGDNNIYEFNFAIK